MIYITNIINNCVFPPVFLCMHIAMICVCVCVYVCVCDGQTHVISPDGYALIRKTLPLHSHACSVCMCGVCVSLSQVEAGGKKYSHQ